MRKATALILALIFLPTVALADDKIKLFKAGTSPLFTQDMHCMDGDTALKILGKFKLCGEACDIKLNELTNLKDIDISFLRKDIVLQKEKYLRIIDEKDKTIDKLYTSAITDLSSDNFVWWEITLMVVGGVIVGAATTATALYFTE